MEAVNIAGQAYLLLIDETERCLMLQCRYHARLKRIVAINDSRKIFPQSYHYPEHAS